MAVWGLAVDKNRKNASYEEIKERGVIAQGWPKLGNVHELVSLVATSGEQFELEIRKRAGEVGYEATAGKAAKVLRRLLLIEKGDLVVAFEGRTVCGIVEAPQSAIDAYWHDETAKDYQQCVARHVQWVDWPDGIVAPNASKQGIPGVSRLRRKNEESTLQAWRRIAPKSRADTEPQFDDPPDYSMTDLTLEALKRRAYQSANQSGAVRSGTRWHYQRCQVIRTYVLRRASGRCESCKNPAPFQRPNGTAYLETHHIRAVSDQGLDHPRWIAAVCPTCHRRVHHGSDGKEFNESIMAEIARIEKEP